LVAPGVEAANIPSSRSKYSRRGDIMGWYRIFAGVVVTFALSGESQIFASSIKTNIAHRGASGYLPEHTLEAASLAHGMGADYIEPDLVLTRDNQVIVLHDLRLDTTTNVSSVFPARKRKDGHWYAIDFTLSEIKRLRVGERRNKTGEAAYPDRFPSQNLLFEVPTFSEFIDLVQGLNQSSGKSIGIYPEIKEPGFHKKAGKDITRIVYQTLKDKGYDKKPEQIFLQCFDPLELKRLKTEFKTRIPLIQLIGINSWWKNPPADYEAMLTKEGLKEIATYASGIGPWTGHILQKHQHGNIMASTGLVAMAHVQGLLVHAYTARADALPPGVRNFHDLLELLFKKEKVDGLFTDFPDKVRSFLQSQTSSKKKSIGT